MFFPTEEEIDIKDNTNDLHDASVIWSGLRRIATKDMATQNTRPWINHQYIWYSIYPWHLSPPILPDKGGSHQEGPHFAQYKEQNSSAPKKQHLDKLKQPSKLMSSKRDYAPYKNVLPSARTLNDYKQLLAVQPEADAANALFTVMYNVQCT